MSYISKQEQTSQGNSSYGTPEWKRQWQVTYFCYILLKDKLYFSTVQWMVSSFQKDLS